MRGSIRNTLVLAWSLLFLVACRGSSETEPSPTPSPTAPSTPRETTLSPSEPTARVGLAAITGSPNYLEIRLASIRNPEDEGFSVRVAVELTDENGEAQVQEIGHISPFPPDNPGTFKMKVPDPVARALSVNKGPVAVVMSLEPSSPDRPLRGDIRVAIEDEVKFSDA